MTDTAPDRDVEFLLQAVILAAHARATGDHPFGALLVDHSGAVAATALNTVVTMSDPIGHAETNLVREASRSFTPTELSTMTMYTSTEPCAMCAGATYWARIGTVVYAMAESELRAMTGTDPKNPSMNLPCREVLACGVGEVTVRGPFPLPEARDVHAGFWTP